MNRYSPRDVLVLVGVAFLFLYTSGIGAQFQRSPTTILALAVALAVAITVHEANHAWVATLLGDETPRGMGRVSLNPLRHLDPIGTFMIFFPPHFGWGKPVLYNPWNLRIDPHIGSAMVALAGPLANIVAAIVFLLPLRFQPTASPQLIEILQVVISLNVGLAAFNLLPIAPLDGFSVLTGVLPRRIARYFEPLRTYGIFILLGLVLLPLFGGPNILGIILNPVQAMIFRVVRGVALGV